MSLQVTAVAVAALILGFGTGPVAREFAREVAISSASSAAREAALASCPRLQPCPEVIEVTAPCEAGNSTSDDADPRLQYTAAGGVGAAAALALQWLASKRRQRPPVAAAPVAAIADDPWRGFTVIDDRVPDAPRSRKKPASKLR